MNPWPRTRVLVLLLPLVTGLAFDGGGREDDDLQGSNSSDAETASSPLSGVRKCCPPGLKMFRVDAPGCENEVTCRIPDWNETTGHLFSLGDSGGSYGFPTACPRENCALMLLDGKQGDGAWIEPACVDKLVEMDSEGRAVSESLAGKACLPRDSPSPRLVAERVPEPTVAPILKCCPFNQVYSLAARLCVGGGQVDSNEVTTDSDSVTDFYDEATVPQPFLRRVLDANFADLRVGFPHCSLAAVDVAVFDLAIDKHLVDNDGNARLSPAPRIGVQDSHLHVGWVLPPGQFCVDEAFNSSGTIVVKVCRNDPDVVCRLFGCFKKCCPPGQYFVPDGYTHNCKPKPERLPLLPQVHLVPENDSAAQDYLPVSREELVDAAYDAHVRGLGSQQVVFSTVTDNICPDFRYRLSREMNDVWFFDELGSLYQPDYPPPDRVIHQYCMEDSADEGPSVLLCLPPRDPTQEEESSRIQLITVGLLISCLFLAATLGTYCCLPALQNLHGKTLMCHVSSLLIAYLCLALTQLLTKLVFLENEWVCSIIGNCVLFTFLSAFSWLNVMCFDIWRTFGAVKSSRSLKRSSASRRFRWYCVYAWGLSSVITIVCVTVDQWPGSDKSVFRPQMGDGSCWFRTGREAYGIFIFFVGPLLVQTCSNLVLFVLTVRNYSRIKSEINRLRNPPTSRKVKKFEADSNKLKMNLKLFVVMGVTWVLELVSTFFPDDQAVFYLSDSANALQGVMIFAIFVLKRKVVRALAVRMGRAPPPTSLSANPSLSIHADSRLAVRGKTASSSTLFTSEFRCSAVSSRNAETSQ